MDAKRRNARAARPPRWAAILALVCALAGTTGSQAQEAGEVDLQLVLAADVSGSMNSDELQLQRNGYVSAFRHPHVMDAIRSGPLGRIAVTYVEWAGSDQQAVMVPWTVLSDPSSIEGFAKRLQSAPTSGPGSRTAISSAILFAADLFASSGMRSVRRAIDVSGDGAGDQGPPIAPVRDLVAARRITINGLSMDLAASDTNGPYAESFDDGIIDIHSYYRERVIGGPGAFAIAVDDIEDFGPAILRKLITEIAWRATSQLAAQRSGCRPERTGG